MGPFQIVPGDDGRLAVGDRSLRSGEPLEILIHGAWVPARVEWDADLGWYAAVCQQIGDGGTAHVLLRVGMIARLPET